MSKIVAIIFFLFFCISFSNAQELDDISPLVAGTQVPEAIIYKQTGAPVDIQEILLDQKIVLVFYRGGWCPYCKKHLGWLKDGYQTVLDQGYSIIALSADKYDKAEKIDKHKKLPYAVYSDYFMNAAKAFGISFKLDDDTYRNYRHLQLLNPNDVEIKQGKEFDVLPVPAVFIIKNNEIKFSYANPDYKYRMSIEQIMEQIKQIEAE